MALVKASLQAQILSVYNQQLKDQNQIAAKIADAYEAYARLAQGPGGEPVILTGNEKQAIKNALVPVMKNHLLIAPGSLLMAPALTQFWLAPPVKVGPLGQCSAIVASTAVAMMNTINAKSYSEAAGKLADALDAATKTVIVIYTPPPPKPPGPLM